MKTQCVEQSAPAVPVQSIEHWESVSQWIKVAPYWGDATRPKVLLSGHVSIKTES